MPMVLLTLSVYPHAAMIFYQQSITTVNNRH